MGETLMVEDGKTDSVIASSKQQLGITSVGVKFCFTENIQRDIRWQGEPIKYCEAVNKVMESSQGMLLKGENISCPAAKEILGLTRCEQCEFRECLKELTEKNKFTSQEAAFKALTAILRLGVKPKSIILSTTCNQPDIYIFYIRPNKFMRIVQAYQRFMGEEMKLDVSSVMPVCGNCTVRSYVTNRVCVSFGCKDSRECGSLKEDKFVVGMPALKAELIMQSLKEMGKEA